MAATTPVVRTNSLPTGARTAPVRPPAAATTADRRLRLVTRFLPPQLEGADLLPGRRRHPLRAHRFAVRRARPERDRLGALSRPDWGGSDRIVCSTTAMAGSTLDPAVAAPWGQSREIIMSRRPSASLGERFGRSRCCGSSQSPSCASRSPPRRTRPSPTTPTPGWRAFGSEVIARNDPAEQEKIIKFNSLLANCAIFHTALDMTVVIRQLIAEGWIVDLRRPRQHLPVHHRASQALRRIPDRGADGPARSVRPTPRVARQPRRRRGGVTHSITERPSFSLPDPGAGSGRRRSDAIRATATGRLRQGADQDRRGKPFAEIRRVSSGAGRRIMTSAGTRSRSHSRSPLLRPCLGCRSRR